VTETLVYDWMPVSDLSQAIQIELDGSWFVLLNDSLVLTLHCVYRLPRRRGCYAGCFQVRTAVASIFH